MIRKIGLLFLIGIFMLPVFQGCTVLQQASGTDGAPTALDWKNGIKGRWFLMSIEHEKFPKGYTVRTLFEEAPLECFIESAWDLPMNGNGQIHFTAEGRLCAPGAVRNIYWSVFNPGKGNGEPQFQFKKIYPGDHHKHVLTAYRLELAYADQESLTMYMPVPLDDGTNGNLVFKFIRRN